MNEDFHRVNSKTKFKLMLCFNKFLNIDKPKLQDLKNNCR